MTTYSLHEQAARLFRVPPDEVTPAMLARVRTLSTAVTLDSTGTWGTCPQCSQSVTGKYAGKLACTRCNWNESRGVLPLSAIR